MPLFWMVAPLNNKLILFAHFKSLIFRLYAMPLRYSDNGAMAGPSLRFGTCTALRWVWGGVAGRRAWWTQHSPHWLFSVHPTHSGGHESNLYTDWALFADFCISRSRFPAMLFPSLQNTSESSWSFCAGIMSRAPALGLFLSCSLCPSDLLKMSFCRLLMKTKLNLGIRARGGWARARMCCLRPWLGCLPATLEK